MTTTPSQIHFTRKQMARIIYQAMRDTNTPRLQSLWVAIRECKPVTVAVNSEGVNHA